MKQNKEINHPVAKSAAAEDARRLTVDDHVTMPDSDIHKKIATNVKTYTQSAPHTAETDSSYTLRCNSRKDQLSTSLSSDNLKLCTVENLYSMPLNT